MKLCKQLYLTATLALVTAPVLAMPMLEVDFDGNPLPADAQLYGDAVVRAADGNPGGYLSLTDALNGQRSSVIFGEFAGDPITDFKLTVDVRDGAGTDRPADGFSFNLARPGDPVLGDGLNGWASSPSGGEANQPEEGTTTGLSIGFDEWQSGDMDVIGFSVRVDNVLVSQIELPTLNGAVDDVTSLQTGPNDQGLAGLGWAELAIMLSIDQVLTINWKGALIFSDMIAIAPIADGRLIFGSRTGGANANHHVDNINFMGNTGSAAVPEPSTATLLLIALLGVGWSTRRWRYQSGRA